MWAEDGWGREGKAQGWGGDQKELELAVVESRTVSSTVWTHERLKRSGQKRPGEKSK